MIPSRNNLKLEETNYLSKISSSSKIILDIDGVKNLNGWYLEFSKFK